jgi:hypothetical protein
VPRLSALRHTICLVGQPGTIANPIRTDRGNTNTAADIYKNICWDTQGRKRKKLPPAERTQYARAFIVIQQFASVHHVTCPIGGDLDGCVANSFFPVRS